MIIFLLALIGALIVMAILSIGRLSFGRQDRFDSRKFGSWFLAYFIFNYVFCLAILYFGLPALTGPFWGWQWVAWPLFISSIVNLFTSGVTGVNALATGIGTLSNARRSLSATGSRRGIAAGLFGLLMVALLGVVATVFITIFTTWFDVNAKALAAIPNVRTETTASLPQTDPNHIVLVSESVASYKGQQVLGSTGQNLGSAYNIDPASYSLQSINHHLYYVAQLSYNNFFVNLSHPTTPGFVMVDAEDPQQPPQLHTEPQAAIKYLPGAIFNQDLLRYVYLSGYTYGNLVDPTLELDDSLHPYWTISLMQPSRGYTGNTLSEVLLVNANTGEIKKYAPQNVPAWVDRVMPSETVSQYLQWWGLYSNAPWFNPSGAGQQSPSGSPELLYNNADQPVWLLPMTSASANDNSSTGIFLFDTHKNQATFYAKTAGLGIGDNVQSTFQSTRANIRNYKVASVQLYQIYNTPTWVAIYVQTTSSGDIFQAVGLVNARELNGGNVQFESSLSAALADYQQWLLQPGNTDNGGNISGSTKGPQTVTGKVQRISSITQGSNTVYYLKLDDQGTIFTANLNLSPKLPLVQPGDTVTVTFSNNGGSVINVSAIDDTDITIGAVGTPGATPTRTALPGR
ncbi:TOBE domain-containing protein [Tengunoibacter tsumagoiensis]|uniref:CvpA family protein n=1 Tax=Tengunoibacter tsumagoiensis TaxID=2014871 RepID=A0A401ZX97_9CHLR|nr:TOBE domain-containing protein [Tengunoibacter tsumagoiensis]GCE11469.1 hypothetical protein KTT_13280 [Tengunoibacter tsumagoiensis]